MKKKNYYIELLDLLESKAPDTAQDIDQARFECDNMLFWDDTEYHKEQSKKYISHIIDEWIETLQEVKKTIAGDDDTTN